MISVFWWSVCPDDQCVLMISVSWWSVCPVSVSLCPGVEEPIWPRGVFHCGSLLWGTGRGTHSACRQYLAGISLTSDWFLINIWLTYDWHLTDIWLTSKTDILLTSDWHLTDIRLTPDWHMTDTWLTSNWLTSYWHPADMLLTYFVPISNYWMA